VLEQGGLQIGADDFELAGIQHAYPGCTSRCERVGDKDRNLLHGENMNHVVVNYDGSAVKCRERGCCAD